MGFGISVTERQAGLKTTMIECTMITSYSLYLYTFIYHDSQYYFQSPRFK